MAATLAASTPRRSKIDEEDDEDPHSDNIPPSNASRIIEHLDGSDDEGGDTAGRKAATLARAPSVIDLDKESSDEGPAAVANSKETNKIDETNKAKRGRIQSHESIRNMLMSMQIAL
jgi:hypothetical protein